MSMLAEPNTSSTDTDTAELLWKLSSFGFSLLSPNDQQDKIEQFSQELDAGVADVKRLEGETEEDLRRKKFAELFNNAPVFKRRRLFRDFTDKFFRERKVCEAILLFRQLDCNEQQEWIDEDVILERLSEESEEDFRLRRFTKLCSRNKFLLDNFVRDKAEERDLKSLHMHKSGEKEIELIKQSRYAEFYLGLASIWFKERWASDPKGLIDSIISKVGEGDHIIEKLVNETDEDFRLRRFTESFKQLQFSSQENFIEDIVFDDRDITNRIVAKGARNCGIISDFNSYGRRSSRTEPHLFAPMFKKVKTPTFKRVKTPTFKKVKTPNLEEPTGAVATQGGGQGASQQ